MEEARKAVASLPWVDQKSFSADVFKQEVKFTLKDSKAFNEKQLLAAFDKAGFPKTKVVAPVRVFEMRTYYAHPGKMKALHERFRNHTCSLFEKHGMTLIGFWSPIDAKDAEEKMVYVLAYPSKEAAEKSWKAFREDPDWLKAKAASEKDGPLVAKVDSVFLNPTDYSPVK